MKLKGKIFKNSKKYINEGKESGQGILYCGDKYTNESGCPCGTCDGYCGGDNGCPCPDCDYTLAYILYSSGKMKCENCQKDLIRIKISDLKNIYISKDKYNNNFVCNICHQTQFYTFIPLMHCLKCNYNMCPKCAFQKITPIEPEIPKFDQGTNNGVGMIYCGKNYTEKNYCLCGKCDGICGKEAGCPCPLCDTILGYNIYLNSNNLRCYACKTLLVKTTVFLLKIAKVEVTPCIFCSEKFDSNDFQAIYHCKKSKINVCQKCAYQKCIKDIKNIKMPNMPLFLDNIEKTIQEKILKDKIKECKISKQRRFRIADKKVKGNNIEIYLKSILGRIYTVIIDENEDMSQLREELRKLNNKSINSNCMLFHKNKKLEDYEYLKDVGINNESVIDMI